MTDSPYENRLFMGSPNPQRSKVRQKKYLSLKIVTEKTVINLMNFLPILVALICILPREEVLGSC